MNIKKRPSFLYGGLSSLIFLILSIGVPVQAEETAEKGTSVLQAFSGSRQLSAPAGMVLTAQAAETEAEAGSSSSTAEGTPLVPSESSTSDSSPKPLEPTEASSSITSSANAQPLHPGSSSSSDSAGTPATVSPIHPRTSSSPSNQTGAVKGGQPVASPKGNTGSKQSNKPNQTATSKELPARSSSSKNQKNKKANVNTILPATGSKETIFFPLTGSLLLTYLICQKVRLTGDCV